eukprot:3390660-Pyramimonas_sp.AAC.2
MHSKHQLHTDDHIYAHDNRHAYVRIYTLTDTDAHVLATIAQLRRKIYEDEVNIDMEKLSLGIFQTEEVDPSLQKSEKRTISELGPGSAFGFTAHKGTDFAPVPSIQYSRRAPSGCTIAYCAVLQQWCYVRAVWFVLRASVWRVTGKEHPPRLSDAYSRSAEEPFKEPADPFERVHAQGLRVVSALVQAEGHEGPGEWAAGGHCGRATRDAHLHTMESASDPAAGIGGVDGAPQKGGGPIGGGAGEANMYSEGALNSHPPVVGSTAAIKGTGC